MSKYVLWAGAAALTILSACDEGADEAPVEEASAPPVAKWDFKPEGETWSEATLAALGSHGAALTDVVPSDIAQWCPAYPQAEEEQRAAFWTGLISALAEHESTWRQTAVGGDGR